MDEIDKKRLRAKIMMQGLLMGIAEIAKEDENIRNHLKGWERIIQYSIAPDGPHMHFVVRDGTMTAVHGLHAAPAATICFADLEAALAIFGRKLDPQAAFMQGKVQIAGEVADAMRMTMISQLAQPYFTM